MLVVTANDAAGNSSSNIVNVVQSDVTLTVDSADIVAEYAEGTVSDPTCTVWVNGMEADNSDGYWAIWGLNLNLNNTVVQARAIPNSDNGGSGTGGGSNGGVGSPDVGNPSSPSATDAEMELPWPDGVVYTKTVHLSQYNYWQNDSATVTSLFRDKTVWAEMSGGAEKTTYMDTGPVYQETDTTTWPGGVFPIFPDGTLADSANGTSTTVDPPFVEGDIWFYHDVDYSGPADSPADSCILHYHDDEEMVLVTGGAPGATGTALYAISIQNLGLDPWTGLPLPLLPFKIVALDNMGTFDTNGLLWVELPVRTAVVLALHLLEPPPFTEGGLLGAPVAQVRPYDAIKLGIQPYHLQHLAECTAAGDTNNSRTTIGIGEIVDLGGMPANTIWSLSGGGSISPTNGGGTTLTASLSPGPTTITAQLGSNQFSPTFNVIPPTGFSATVRTNWGWGASGTNTIGANTIYWVQLLPTNVSFAHAPMREVLPRSPTHFWPDGHQGASPAKTIDWGLGGDCGPQFQDGIADGPFPIAWLFNGTYQDFSYSLTWTNYYLNAASNWVAFATPSSTTIFHGSDQSCQVTYEGLSGTFQGPWQRAP